MARWRFIIGLGLICLGSTTSPQIAHSKDIQSPDRQRTETWNEVYPIVQRRIAETNLFAPGEKTMVRKDQLTYWVSEAILNFLEGPAKRAAHDSEKRVRLINRAFNTLRSSINYVATTRNLSSAAIALRFKEDLGSLTIQ